MNSVTNVPIKTFADTNVYQYVLMIYIKLKEFPNFRGALIVLLDIVLDGRWGDGKVCFNQLQQRHSNQGRCSPYFFFKFLLLLFYDGGPCHIETCPLICRANQWTGFHMIGTSVMKGLNL